MGESKPEPVNPETLANIEMWADHWNVLSEAQRIHIERTPQRGQLWLDDGRDKMIECAWDKIVRVQHNIKTSNLPFIEDDVLDAINYLAFAIQCHRRGRIDRDYGPEPGDA